MLKFKKNRFDENGRKKNFSEAYPYENEKGLKEIIDVISALEYTQEELFDILDGKFDSIFIKIWIAVRNRRKYFLGLGKGDLMGHTAFFIEVYNNHKKRKSLGYSIKPLQEDNSKLGLFVMASDN